MQNAYIVASKNAKKAHFSSKMAENIEKSPVFGKNRAKIAFFINFAGRKGVDSQKTQKGLIFGNSFSESFENYSIHGRVSLCSSQGYKTKNRLPLVGRAVLKS